MNRANHRELTVGLILILALALFSALLFQARKGPGFLASQREIDVVFADGQGIRAGSPVRVAGLDMGQVSGVDLAEGQGRLWARVRLTIPSSLAEKFRKDVKITIQNSITGQNCVNIIATGSSAESLAEGEIVQGVETSFMDPILEDIGLGPDQRGDIQHMIRRIRALVDESGPKLSHAMDDVQETLAQVKQSVDQGHPQVQGSLAAVRDLTERLNKQAPRIEETLAQLDQLTTQLNMAVKETRPTLQTTMVQVQDITSVVKQLLIAERPKISKLIDGLEPIRLRTERVLYNAELISEQSAEMIVKNRANLERVVANVRDATDWADQLVQKLYANPFVLSPFYKPKPEDIRAQSAMDTARVFMKGAKELADLLKTLEAMQNLPMTPQRRKEFDLMYKRAWTLMEWMGQTQTQLSDGLRGAVRR